MKLTGIARASQEELVADYLAFLRQRSLPIRDPGSDEAKTGRAAKPEDLSQLRQLMAFLVSDKSDKKLLKQEVAANTMICLIRQKTFLSDRQISRLCAIFEKEGGFTERLYRIRSQNRTQKMDNSKPE